MQNKSRINLTPRQVIEMLGLEPLPEEGGFYRETFRSDLQLSRECLPQVYTDSRSAYTCIYYLVTPESFSALHRLPADEIWHFYLGDPLEQLQLFPGGRGKIILLGQDLENNEHPQVCVPAGVWQGTRLKDGGRYALVGTTMAPGFEFADFEAAEEQDILLTYSAMKDEIRKYFHT
ncbi:MAG: cupin domain-containing protein [Bacteroidota bacterium]